MPGQEQEHNMLMDQIQNDLNAAMKAGDSKKVGVLRFLLSEIKNFDIAHYPPGSNQSMTDADVISVIKKSVKSRRESIEMFKKGGRTDLVLKEEEELSLLQNYLPKEMGEDEVRKTVKEVISSMGGEKNFGQVMGAVMGKLQGRADGSQVSKIVKEELEK